MTNRMKKMNSAVVSAAMLALAALSTSAYADFSGATGSTYQTVTNWDSNTINDTFTRNVVANFTVNLTSATSPTLQDYATTSNGFQFLYQDIFTLTILPSANNTTHYVTLNGNATTRLGGNTKVILGSATRTFNINLNNASRTFFIQPTGGTAFTGAGSLEVFGDIKDFGAGNTGGVLLKDGFGKLVLDKAVTMTNDLIIKNGTVALQTQGSMLNLNSVQFQSATTELLLNNTTTTSNLTDRLKDSAPVVFRGGVLVLLEQSAAVSTETVGPVTIESSMASIGIKQSTAGGSAALTISSLARQNSALLGVGGGTNSDLLGTTNKIVVTGGQVTTGTGLAQTTTNIIDGLVGGSTTAGVTGEKILPWAVFTGPTDTSTAPYAPVDVNNAVGGFVTYDNTNGFRGLNLSSEYAAGLAASVSATDNVRVIAATATAISNGQTINSLYLDGSTAGSPINQDLGGNTLNITSGAIATSGLGGTTTTISNGTINFGSTPGIIFGGSGTTAIGAAMTGSNGIIISLGGTVNLSGTNTYTGDTIVWGTLKTTGASNRLPTGTNLRIGVGGIVNIGTDVTGALARTETVASLSGRGTVNLTTTAGASSSLTIGTGAKTDGAISVYGAVSPGDAEGTLVAGTLNIGTAGVPANATNVIFNTGSSLNLDLASISKYDVVAVANGSVVINDGTLNINLLNGYATNPGDTFTLLTATGGISGTLFTTITSSSGIPFTEAVVGGTSLQITATPEPSTMALVSLGGLLMLRRQKRS